MSSNVIHVMHVIHVIASLICSSFEGCLGRSHHSALIGAAIRAAITPIIRLGIPGMGDPCIRMAFETHNEPKKTMILVFL
jgi:hypothetical protein